MILYAAGPRHSHSRPVPRPAPELVWHRFEDEARMMVPGDKMRCPYRMFIKATMYGPNGCMGLFGLFIFIYIYICVCVSAMCSLDADKLRFDCTPAVLVASCRHHPQMLHSQFPWGCKDIGRITKFSNWILNHNTPWHASFKNAHTLF